MILTFSLGFRVYDDAEGIELTVERALTCQH
jgi:hypothetical protein